MRQIQCSTLKHKLCYLQQILQVEPSVHQTMLNQNPSHQLNQLHHPPLKTNKDTCKLIKFIYIYNVSSASISYCQFKFRQIYCKSFSGFSCWALPLLAAILLNHERIKRRPTILANLCQTSSKSLLTCTNRLQVTH